MQLLPVRGEQLQDRAVRGFGGQLHSYAGLAEGDDDTGHRVTVGFRFHRCADAVGGVAGGSGEMQRPATIQRGLQVVPGGIVGILCAVQPRHGQGAVHRVRAAGIIG